MVLQPLILQYTMGMCRYRLDHILTDNHFIYYYYISEIFSRHFLPYAAPMQFDHYMYCVLCE